MKSFSSYHPLVLMVYFISVLIITMITMHPVLLVLSFAGSMLFLFSLEGAKASFKSLGFYIPLFVLIAVTNPLFSHNGVTPLFFMNGNPVTYEAIIYGAAIGGMLIGVLYWCRCYNSVMTTDKFVYLFGRIIPKLSLVISMALRFIPVFISEMKKINAVQKTMGLYTSKSFTDRISGGIRVFSALVTWALENSVNTANSMKARGYGLKGRTNFSLFKFEKKDLVFLILEIILFIIVLSGIISNDLFFAYYPKITGVKVSDFAVISYTAMLILTLLPFAEELKENIKWKYLVSKI